MICDVCGIDAVDSLGHCSHCAETPVESPQAPAYAPPLGKVVVRKERKPKVTRDPYKRRTTAAVKKGGKKR